MKRGATPIYYTDFSDLKSIIQLNWPDFEDLFHDVNWVIMRFTELEASRNIVAHNNVLEKNEIDRIKMYLVDLGATSRLAPSVESRCPPKVLDTQSARPASAGRVRRR